MKLVTIIGARPQFIKAAAVSAALKNYNSIPNTQYPIHEIIVHTGQHYDYEMSKLFFEELNIPEPNYNLGIGSSTHGVQTANMLAKIEQVLLKEKPDMVLVYGDTNSTLAGALAAVKLNIPVAHVEAGMRSFNREMPEEINRVLTDHISSILFCSTPTAVENLRREGFTNILDDGKLIDSSNLAYSLKLTAYSFPLVINTGDVMYDIALQSIPIAENKSNILNNLNIRTKQYYLATVHRQSNTDNLENLKNILEAFSELNLPVIFPIHPRTKKAIEKLKAYSLQLTANHNIHFIAPLGYLDMLILEKNSQKILTDSGGIQKEAYFYGVPCITLRDETEWVETVESGWNVLTGPDKGKITKAVKSAVTRQNTDSLYGDGNAAQKIVSIINGYLCRSDKVMVESL